MTRVLVSPLLSQPVMPALGAGIHAAASGVTIRRQRRGVPWMPGSRPGMTVEAFDAT